MFPEDIRPLLLILIPVIGGLFTFVAWVNTRNLPSYEEAGTKQDRSPQ